MQIDERVEEHVRDALAAVIGRDGDAMATSLDGLDQDETVHALVLSLFVVGYVVNDIYSPDGPSKDNFATLAQQIVEAEANWISLDARTVEHLLAAAARGDASAPGVPGEDRLGLALVCGGHLLAAFRAEGERWYEYLDEIWAALEAAPEQVR